MIINKLELPQQLICLIEANRWKTPSKKYFDRLFNKNCFCPELYDLDDIKMETLSILKLNSEDDVDAFVGSYQDGINPGAIDLQKALIIGHTDISSPIALYYSRGNVSVIHLEEYKDDEVWVEISDDFDIFLKKIGFSQCS
ncbi:hypothetical protein [Flammeovirga sp. EKP202]|uniref:hypothetical protein n=1 Tax=Flammeovirga sp. EKP202 TaxID=2770592 RepID=UPI00165FAFCB|nr:hypothetical protein [Flammeovirga sp. EKP202]MBD0401563.1 hypothetical protein [Flammeovirga sp. EKP202]